MKKNSDTPVGSYKVQVHGQPEPDTMTHAVLLKFTAKSKMRYRVWNWRGQLAFVKSFKG